ncbi:MAG: two-component regulator propeller domain-containing protein [Xanthomonadales bacterium]|nr:two-component regulator propeller domain-containing protein [Xanthomonadales bacterium]
MRKLLLAGLGLLVWSAAEPVCEVPLSQWQVTHHDSEAGLPLDALYALGQDAAGFLWVGTEDGLARFDGRSFERIDLTEPLQYGGEYITAILFDEEGYLVVGTNASGTLRMRLTPPFEAKRILADDYRVHALAEAGDGRLIAATRGHGLVLVDPDSAEEFEPMQRRAGSTINDIAPRAAGGWWVGYAGEGIQWFDGQFFHDVAGAESLARSHVSSLVEATDGTLWIGTRTSLLSLDRNGLTEHTGRQGLDEELFVRSLFEDSQGDLWIGLDSGRLFRRCEEEFEQVSEPESDGLTRSHITSIFEDRQHNLWLATGSSGLIQLRKGRALPLTERHGLPAFPILPIMQSADGEMWIGSFGGGVTRLANGEISTFGTGQGLLSDRVLSLLEWNGAVWVGTRSGLNRIAGGQVTDGWSEDDGLPHPTIGAMAADGERLWLGMVDSLAEFREGRIEIWQPEGGFDAPITGLLVDRDGTLWIATDGNGLFWKRGDRIVRTPLEEQMPSHGVTGFFESESGAVWITTARGLVHWDGERARAIGPAQGLPDSHVFSLIEDGIGGTWISSNRGVFKMHTEALEAALSDRTRRLESLHINHSDGMPRSETNGGFQPAVWRAHDGRLWYPTSSGIAIIDPAPLQRVSPPLMPVFRRILSADRLLPVGGDLQLAPLPDWVEFQWASPEFRQATDLVYQYRLTGYDENWFQTAERSAIYRKLPAGDYIFEVRARLPGSSFSDSAGTDLHVERHLLHQPLLWLLSIIVLVAALLLLIQALYRRREQRRIAQIEAQKLESIGLLAGGVAHDFNNVLTIIVGGTENLADRLPVDSILRKDTEQILDAAERAASLTRQLLTFARRQPVTPCWINLANEVDQMRTFLERLLPSHISLEWRSEACGFCYIDPVQLQQVLVNLVLNARNAINGKGRIAVELRPAEPDTGQQSMARLSVTDTGPGIDPALGERIFEPFVTSRPKHGGTGLGLAVSEGIVRQADGRISFTSRLGQGATFDVWLPTRAEPEESA